MLIADGCKADMTFQQCGPVCPQSCDSTDATCHSGCAEGCFCPDGQIINEDGECDEPTTCPGELTHYHISVTVSKSHAIIYIHIFNLNFVHGSISFMVMCII